MFRRSPPSLNGTQKNIIAGVLKFNFDDISKSHPYQAIKAFKAIFNTTIADEDKAVFEQLDILNSIMEIRNILAHPYPQNRAVDLFGLPEDLFDFVFYTNKKGLLFTEPRGLLGLTARNDKDFSPPTKDVVVHFIRTLVDNEIKEVISNTIKKFSNQSLADKNLLLLVRWLPVDIFAENFRYQQEVIQAIVQLEKTVLFDLYNIRMICQNPECADEAVKKLFAQLTENTLQVNKISSPKL